MNAATARTVAVTGASSFTGLWIAREFESCGWTVHALCPRRQAEYAGLRGLRVRLLRDTAHVHFGIRAEDGGLAQWVRAHRPAMWVHHHHWMENFRSPEYDLAQARHIGLDPLDELVAALAQSKAFGVIYSGTYFEPGEGGDPPDAAATPYARSKREVWDALRQHAAAAGLAVAKVVIPNPIGPFENDDRVVPALIRTAFKGERFALTAPDAIADYLPVRLLAQKYVEVTRSLLSGAPLVLRPSGLVTNLRHWVNVVLTELVQRRLGLKPCEVAITANATPGASFRNPEAERVAIDWDLVWDDYAASIKSTDLLSR